MPTLVLASASSARRGLLEAAGVPLTIDPAHIDEDTLKRDGTNSLMPPADIALGLALAKAEATSPRHPGALVLGADQLLVLDGRIYDKPADIDQARRHLLDFRGRTHELISAAALVRDGRKVWSAVNAARLHVRAFSDAFLEDYLTSQGADILGSVGCYRLERMGLQLFDAIDGDYFTVLGLPMLPLLAALRNEGILAP